MSTPTVAPARVRGTILRCDFPIEPVGPGTEVNAVRAGDGTWTLDVKGKPIGTIPAAGATTRVEARPITTRVRPTWATVVGIIGLFFLLIGILFFFVKQDRIVQGAVIEVTAPDGRVLALAVPDEPVALRYGLGATA